LYYHFVSVEPFRGKGFDYAVRLTGSGAPRMTIPIRSTKVINKFLNRGWTLSKTIRLGRNGRRLFVELIFEKPRPSLKEYGRVAGMDSNYKSGLVLSDGQNVGQEIYQRIQTFGKHQKHTHAEIKSLVGHAIRQIDFSGIRVLCIEELKRVKYHKRGTFPRSLNRRLSHWLYNYIVGILRRYCEELGIRLEEKSPWKTSQYCRFCNRWDRRNRRGDKFICVHCKCSEDADYNASKNLELLGLAGVYGLRSLINSDRCLENNGFE